MVQIRARSQGTKNIYVHNDLANAASHFKEQIEAKLEADDKKGIAFEYMACMTMLAFAFEARINFIGQRELASWDELWPTKDKVKTVLKHLRLTRDWNKRPYSSIVLLKEFRNLIAHGKPIDDVFDEEIVKSAEILDRPEVLDSEWRKFCSHDQVFNTFDDVDVIWNELLKAAGIPLFETLTRGSGRLSFIEFVPDEQDARQSLYAGNGVKARFVFWSQIALVLAISLVIVLVAMVMFVT